MRNSLANKALNEPLAAYLVSMADDELILGHRDSEWTGHSPILEEDIAFSNIAQDEIGHSLVWFTLNEELGGKDPDWMVFQRPCRDYTCSRFVSYPKGDFAYTVVRQYFFDKAEQVRLTALSQSAYEPLKGASEKILREETYHLLHSQSLLERLGDATEESHARMQRGVDAAFPQALGLFEATDREQELVDAGVATASEHLKQRWLEGVLPVLVLAGLNAPVQGNNGGRTVLCQPDLGGRKKQHTSHLEQIVTDMQSVYQISPGGRW